MLIALANASAVTSAPAPAPSPDPAEAECDRGGGANITPSPVPPSPPASHGLGSHLPSSPPPPSILQPPLLLSSSECECESSAQPPLCTSSERDSSAWGPEESCSSCNMAEPQDMAMVPVPVDGKDQEHGTAAAVAEAEGTTNKEVVIDVKETEKPERKELAARSEMWHHFIKIKDEKGFLKAGKCKYCHRDIKADPNCHGTSALKKHFNICKKNPHVFNKDPKQGTLQACHGEAPTTWRFDQDALREAFAKMVIEDEQPFCFGEKPGFRKFMSKACPHFQPPSRRTCTRDIVRQYFEEKAKLKFFKESCQRVCLTTDAWTSQVQDGYMTVTASFIDEYWHLHKKVISFFMVKGHKGEDIGKNMTRCLADWGLDKVLTVTVDNASANDTGVDYLKKQLQKTNIAKGKFMHIRCGAHISNLIVRDGLQEVDPSVKRVRAAVRYIKNGTSRLVKFKEIAEEEKVDSKAFLKLDCPTRWNSTYLMLNAAIVYEKVFLRLAEEDPNYVIDLSEARDGFGHPDEDDWDNAKKMEKFLQHFYDLIVRISSSLQVTSNTFFYEIGEVCLLIQEWLNSEDSLQVSMGKRMKEKFDKYWGVWHTNSKDSEKGQQQEQDRDKGRSKGRGKEKEKDKENVNLLIFVATFLDPRYKLSLYLKISVEEIFGEEKGQLVWAAINACVTELFEEYKNMYAPSEETTPVVDADKSKRVAGGMLKDKIAKKMKLNNCSTSTNKSELEKYLAEETEDIESKIDILAWWKVSSARFPVLGHMAHDVLAIPITTVASESAFSAGGRILDDFRTSLTPFMLEALVCTQDWLRRPAVDIREITEELAIVQQEWIEEYGGGGNGKNKEQPSVTVTVGTTNTKSQTPSSVQTTSTATPNS